MDALSGVLTLFKSGVELFAGLWGLWGAIIIGTAMKDKNGADLKSGIGQLAGAALIFAAAALFTKLSMTV